MPPSRVSAGILLFRRAGDAPEVLLAHPGGPFFARKDDGSWTIPKGLVGDGEDPLVAARRELEEEIGLSVEGPFLPLGSVRQKGGKVVHAWAVEGDFDPGSITSNTFELEWPPRSGRRQAFPEIDRAAFFGLAEARRKMIAAQAVLLDRLLERLR